MIGGHLYGDRTTLIRGGYLLTLDPALGDLLNADVLIDGNKILAVGSGLNAGPHANVIDARNRIVMPGFVDTHRHAWQTPVRVDLPRLLQRLSNARDYLLSKAGMIPQWVLSRRD